MSDQTRKNGSFNEKTKRRNENRNSNWTKVTRHASRLDCDGSAALNLLIPRLHSPYSAAAAHLALLTLPSLPHLLHTPQSASETSKSENRRRHRAHSVLTVLTRAPGVFQNPEHPFAWNSLPKTGYQQANERAMKSGKERTKLVSKPSEMR
jgi:hypothetical protein